MPIFSYILQPALDASANPADVSTALATTLETIVPRDLAVDPKTGDLEIPVRILKGADAILQRVWIRIRFFLAEWFLDQRLGVPWRERILVKGADSRDAKQILQRVVEKTPGVARVTQFDAQLNARTRVLTIPTMVFVADDGTTITAKQEEPFIV